MGFNELLGNERIVTALRGMLRRDRAPGALLFTGPRGIGKYTLARMFAQAANCERLQDDFCGECESCKRMAPLADPAALIAAGLTERGESADAAMVERMPLIIETASGRVAAGAGSGAPPRARCAPDDSRGPVARGATRRIFQTAGPPAHLHSGRRAHHALERRRPVPENPGRATGKRDADSARADARFACCKPSARAACNSISRRCRWSKSKSFSANAREAKAPERKLAAQLSSGSPGMALALNLEESARLRRSVLSLLEKTINGGKTAEIFAATAQLAKQEKESFENILTLFYSLLTDLLELSQGPKSSLARNPDLRRELEALSRKIDFEWVSRATQGLDRLENRLKRNISRQLGLDALLLSLSNR